MKLNIIITLLVGTFMGCVSGKNQNTEVVSSKTTSTSNRHVDPKHAPWHQGTVESAFEKAKIENKPVFLYWGAVWCPPCNEIKSEVFSNPRFAEIVAPTISVYLDGDTERAQIWGDKLEIGGYPTILVISSGGKELARINGGVNIDEFSDIMNSSINANSGLDKIIARAQTDKATTDDWKLLAYFSWGQLPESREIDITKRLDLFKSFADNCPDKLVREKALFASNYIETNAEAIASEDKKIKALATSNQKHADKYLEAMIGSPESIKATRNSLIYNTPEILNWGWPKGNKKRNSVKKMLLNASKQLRTDKSLSVDTRLWAHSPILQLEQVDLEPGKYPANKKPVSDATKTAIRDAVLQADREATTKYERLSVISGAAYLLRQVQELDIARQILRKELAITSTPYYYQSSFSSLESDAGNFEEALKWMAKARKSASGRATRLQWLVSDLSMNAKIKSKNQEKYLIELTNDYYKTVFELSDGFAGRNKYRAKRVARSLEDWAKKPNFASIIKEAKKKCSTVSKGSRKNCDDHFKELAQ